MTDTTIKHILEKEANKRNDPLELSFQKPDPLFIVHRYKHHPHIDKIALICALLSYGNAHQIIKYLSSLDFTLLDQDHTQASHTSFKAYRFQTAMDVMTLFHTLKQINIHRVFLQGISRGHSGFPIALSGVFALQQEIYKQAKGYQTDGFSFLVGKPFSKGAYKRWNLFLRWGIREDSLDLGFWQGILPKSALLLPLDTHVAHVCRKLGILKRKSNDLKAVLEATDVLLSFDPLDPIKYDFAIYRIGQERILEHLSLDESKGDNESQHS